MSRFFFSGRGASPPQRPPPWRWLSILLLLAGCPEPEDEARVDTHDETSDTYCCGEEDGDGYSIAEGDCDEANADVNPGAAEVCNDVDDNCDGVVDEGVENTYYADVDMDGFGDAVATALGCVAPPGYVQNGDDCDDTSADKFPGNYETCDALDNDCDGTIDDGGVCP